MDIDHAGSITVAGTGGIKLEDGHHDGLKPTYKSWKYVALCVALSVERSLLAIFSIVVDVQISSIDHFIGRNIER